MPGGTSPVPAASSSMPASASASEQPSPVRPGRPVPTWSQPWWRWSRTALLLVGAMLVVAVPVLGERQESFTDTQVAIASGDVWSVELRLDDVGVRDVSWSRGGITYVAPVDQAMGRAIDVAAGVDVDGPSRGTPSRSEMVRRFTVWAHGINPEVAVQTAPAPPRLSGEAFGWAIPGPLAGVAVLASLAALVLLVRGPAPRHATRWAWFWVLSVVPPVGVAAFLLLGARDEPPAWLGPPRWGRLTGGWAFLVTSIVSTVVTNAF